MKIIIEEYQYPVEVVKDILWEGAFQTVDGMVSINYVGYYFNSRKEVNDCVFILPKVLLEESPGGKDLVFGRYAPESIVNMDASSPLATGEREFIYRFSVWIYRALCVFRKLNKESKIIYQRQVSMMGKGGSASRPRSLMSCYPSCSSRRTIGTSFSLQSRISIRDSIKSTGRGRLPPRKRLLTKGAPLT